MTCQPLSPEAIEYAKKIEQMEPAELHVLSTMLALLEYTRGKEHRDMNGRFRKKQTTADHFRELLNLMQALPEFQSEAEQAAIKVWLDNFAVREEALNAIPD